MKKDYFYNATVVSVYDGDTIRANIDLGFNTWLHNESIRLYGIDAPEIRGEERPEGLKAKDWLSSILKPDTSFMLHSIKDNKEKYGRYLGIIYLDDVNLNEEMISLGLANRYMGS